MRSRLVPVAVGALLALLALGAVLALRPEAPPSAVERAAALSRELRCPDCQGLSVADSPTQAARQIREQIAELIEAGATDDEVRGHFVDRYGDWILLAPPSPVYWIVPLGVLVAGATLLVAWLLRRRGVALESSPPVTDEERRRVREEAEALDA